MAKKLDLTKPVAKKPRKKRVYKTKGESAKVGDTIEKVTNATGIKKAVEIFSNITGMDCGCEERKEKMNQMFMRKRLKARCITRDEYHRLNEALKIERRQIPPKQQVEIATLYSSIFRTRYEVWCDSCPQIWNSKIEDLTGVRDFYSEELAK
jgi:hypothetical protein